MYKIKGGRQQSGFSGKISKNGQIDTSEIDFQESEMCQVQIITHPKQLPSTLRLQQVLVKPRKTTAVHWRQREGGLLSLVNIKSAHPP